MHGSLSSQVQNQAASYNNHLHQYQGDWRLETPQQVFRVEEEKISNQMTHPRYEEFVHKGERFRNHAEFLLCRRLYEKELRKIRLDPAVDNIDFFNDPAENFSPYNIFGNDEIFKFAAVSPKLGKFSQPKYLTALEYDDMRKEFSTNGWDVEPFNVKDIVEFPPLKMLTEQSKLLEVFSSPMQQKNMIQNPVAKPLLEEESAIVLKEYRNKTYNVSSKKRESSGVELNYFSTAYFASTTKNRRKSTMIIFSKMSKEKSSVQFFVLTFVHFVMQKEKTVS